MGLLCGRYQQRTTIAKKHVVLDRHFEVLQHVLYSLIEFRHERMIQKVYVFDQLIDMDFSRIVHICCMIY